MTQISELITEFLSTIEAESSVNTLKAYKSDLNYLKINFDKLSEITEEKLKDIRVKLIENYSEKTIARRWSAWREFFRFCQLRGEIKNNPIFSVHVDPSNRLRVLNQDLNQESLEAICNASSRFRDRALLWFMYSTGARPSELFAYGYFKYLNMAAREFYIDGRTTFLSQQAFSSLEEYFKERETIVGSKAPGLNDPIFINDKGEPLKEMFVYTLFTQTAKMLGFNLNVGALRDSLMMRLYKSGASPEELKYVLGFKSVKSIEPLLRLELK
ncbi:MAG: tyrosine-type recombinase/integrase [Candidatus Caenarcaniphilales bacterium]|nr:tyrosine-type recombinase/integrase [Candidatus Caenarcaniphilales bacterium]